MAAAIEQATPVEPAPGGKPPAAGEPAPLAPGAAPASAPNDSTIRIAHLSDLHFGRGFNGPLWNNLRRIVREHAPHLIIVTGDLVNSPFRWTLKRALKALVELACEAGGAPAATPGNLILVTGN